MAATFSLVGVSFAVLAATGSTADLSYVIAAQAAPSLVFLLVGGVIADRIAPQLVIIAANVMVAVGEGTFGILVLTSHPAVWVMIALELLTGTGVALFYPASMALLPRLVTGRADARGQRDQQADDERGHDGRSRAGRRVRGAVRGGLGARGLRCRHVRDRSAAAGDQGRAARPAGGGRRAGARAEHAPRTARGLVGVPVAHLAVGDRAPVHRGAGRVVRRLPGPRPGRGQGAPRRPGGLGPDLGGRGDRPDRRRPDRAALVAAAADPVRRADRRGDRDLAAVAGHAAAAAA